MNISTKPHQIFDPCCRSTTIGSLPHTDVQEGVELIFKFTPDIPGWPQFPKRDFHENMMAQFTEGLPGLAEDENRITFDTSLPEFPEQMTSFFNAYLNVTESDNMDALDYFNISEQYASGFTAFLRKLGGLPDILFIALKGCVTGPFTLGANLVDQHNRLAYFDDQLRDILIKSAAMKSALQIVRLKPFCDKVIIAIDEPALLYYGSQMFLTVSREDIIHDLNEVADLIHTHNGLAAIHCEEDTDWSLIMETNLDILLFDAYDHMRGMTLYPKELMNFLDRGGSLGWGIVPTLDKDAAATETLDSLLDRFHDGMDQLLNKGFDKSLLLKRALITPSCGMGAVLTPALAERVLTLLKEVSESLRDHYGHEL